MKKYDYVYKLSGVISDKIIEKLKGGNPFKQNKVIYLIMEGILAWCAFTMYKYISVYPILIPLSLCICGVYMVKIFLRIIENDRDYKRVLEIEKELDELTKNIERK